MRWESVPKRATPTTRVFGEQHKVGEGKEEVDSWPSWSALISRETSSICRAHSETVMNLGFAYSPTPWDSAASSSRRIRLQEPRRASWCRSISLTLMSRRMRVCSPRAQFSCSRSCQDVGRHVGVKNTIDNVCPNE